MAARNRAVRTRKGGISKTTGVRGERGPNLKLEVDGRGIKLTEIDSRPIRVVPDCRLECIRFEPPILTDACLDQRDYIRMRGPDILAGAECVYPLFNNGEQIKDRGKEAYDGFRRHITVTVAEQWEVLCLIKPILEKDDVLNRFMKVIHDRLGCACLSPIDYNFTAAVSLNLFLYFTWRKPNDFTPHDPKSLELLLNVIEDITSYIQSAKSKAVIKKFIDPETGDELIINFPYDIINRVVYMLYVGIYFDSVVQLCLTFTDRVDV